MFSPITARSIKVRLLYISLYLGLILGGITMVYPFLIMITGSIESRSDVQNSVFPIWLVDNDQMWNRYLSAKYQANNNLVRMNWSDPDAQLRENKLPPLEGQEQIKLWEEFLSETKLIDDWFYLGFQRATARMPSYTTRLFRKWLLPQYGNDLDRLNRELGTQFVTETTIQAPNVNVIGPAIGQSKILTKFQEFSRTEAKQYRIAWDIGGYYRAMLLPQKLGRDIAIYNQKYQTNYPSYTEVPFPATVPEVGREDWVYFVTKVLRPDFVLLTPSGLAGQAAAGMTKEEFIRTRAKPEDLKVSSLDVRFADWAAKRGIENARIPQREIDRATFEEEKGFWRKEFLTINYNEVIDTVLLHGRSIRNTTILVVLCVAGALFVNPLAAYALSRYKLKQTYFILLFCLATIAFPAEVTMIPVFLQMREFNLLNTFGALVLPGLANGFSIFLLKGFFDSLPKELYEAAELDGASEWMMFWQITMNLSKPILAVIALGAFVSAYSAFFYALILAPDPNMWTIMVNIYQLRMSVDTPVVYASLILTAIPTLLVFIFCQNIILRGIVVPSDK
ncbi:MAG TPA: carbohydrate ABC transporter permease [Chthoniobacteraceae bacterium]|nr:carbohydrate ABC transporter permease [Chthoniobacteraceae bacterium]